MDTVCFPNPAAHQVTVCCPVKMLFRDRNQDLHCIFPGGAEYEVVDPERGYGETFPPGEKLPYDGASPQPFVSGKIVLQEEVLRYS